MIHNIKNLSQIPATLTSFAHALAKSLVRSVGITKQPTTRWYTFLLRPLKPSLDNQPLHLNQGKDLAAAAEALRETTGSTETHRPGFGYPVGGCFSYQHVCRR